MSHEQQLWHHNEDTKILVSCIIWHQLELLCTYHPHQLFILRYCNILSCVAISAFSMKNGHMDTQQLYCHIDTNRRHNLLSNNGDLNISGMLSFHTVVCHLWLTVRYLPFAFIWNINFKIVTNMDTKRSSNSQYWRAAHIGSFNRQLWKLFKLKSLVVRFLEICTNCRNHGYWIRSIHGYSVLCPAIVTPV